MNDQNRITVRLSKTEMATIDVLAQSRGCSRSEAVRVALRMGAPLTKDGFAINFTRFAELLEETAAGMAIVIHRDHDDYLDRIREIVDENIRLYHV